MTSLSGILNSLVGAQANLSNALGDEKLTVTPITDQIVTENDTITFNGTFESGKNYVVIFMNRKTGEIHDGMTTGGPAGNLDIVVPKFNTQGSIDISVCLKGWLYSLGRARYVDFFKIDSDLRISLISPGKASLQLPFSSFRNAPYGISSVQFGSSDPMKSMVGAVFNSSVTGSDSTLEIDTSNSALTPIDIACTFSIEDNSSKTTNIPVDLRIFGPPTFVEMGSTDFMFFTWENSMYSFKTAPHMSSSPTILKNVRQIERDDIQKIAFTSTSCTILTKSGEVLVVGDDVEGSLGVGDVGARLKQPLSLNALEFLPSKIVDLACGETHCIAVDASGTVYTWGGNAAGQCGRVGTLFLPQAVGIDERITRVFASGNSSGALSQDGVLYAWGELKNGSSQKVQRVPEIICKDAVDAALTYAGIVAVQHAPNENSYSCRVFTGDSVLLKEFGAGDAFKLRSGTGHAVLLVNSEMFGFGDNSKSQMGEGAEFADQFVRIDDAVDDVMCGNFFTIFKKNNGTTYAMGQYDDVIYRLPCQILTSDENPNIEGVDSLQKCSQFMVGYAPDGIPVPKLFENQVSSEIAHVATGNRYVLASYPRTTEDGSENSGRLIVFDRERGTYQTIFAPEKQEEIFFGGDFAYGMCTNDDQVIVGARGYSKSDSKQGSVFIFEKSPDFSLSQIISPADPNGETFGRHLYVRGNTLLIGYPHFDNLRGRVDIFSYDGTLWVRQNSLVADSGELGHAMWCSKNEDVIIVSSPWESNDPPSLDTGKIYVIRKGAAGFSLDDKIEIALPPSIGLDDVRKAIGYTMATYEDSSNIIHIFAGAPWTSVGGQRHVGCVVHAIFDTVSNTSRVENVILPSGAEADGFFGDKIACSENGILAIGENSGNGGKISVYDVSSGGLVKIFIHKTGGTDRITSVSVNPNGTIVSYVSADNVVKQIRIRGPSRV